MTFEVDASKFYSWYYNAYATVRTMKNVFERIIPIVQTHTRPFIPLERGFLERSMEDRIMNNFPFIELQMVWSGKENIYAHGYDYAYYQNIMNVYHPKRPKGQNASHFVEKGIEASFPNVMVVIETDYLSALGVKF